MMIKKYFFIAVLIAIPTTVCFAQTSSTGQAAAAAAAVAPNSQTVPTGLAAATYKCFEDYPINHWYMKTADGKWQKEGDSSTIVNDGQLTEAAASTCGTPPTGTTTQTVGGGEAPNSAAFLPIPTNLQVPATTAPAPATANGKVKLIVLAKKSGTNRPIGAVKITMTDGTNSQDVTLSDPPDPSGQAIFQAIPGKYTLNISRAGYQPIANKQVELTSSGGDLKISIDLVVDLNTASPELDYQARMLAQYYANTNNPTSLGYPYNSYSNTSQFGSQYPNSNSGVAPYNSYPQQYPTNLNQNASAYPYNSTNQYSPTLAQNGYMLTSNQSSVIPIIVNAQMNGLFSANQNSTVTLINPSTGSSIIIFSGGASGSVSVSTLTNQFTRSGCVTPNTQYILRVSVNQQTVTTQLPYQDFPFNSPGIGSYVNVNIQPPLSISYGGSNLANTTIQNYPLQNPAQLGFTCPSTYNSASQTPAWPVPSTNYNYPQQTTPQTQYGTTTWTDQVINPTNFGAYHIVQDPLKTGYFVVSSINAFDQRQITFVENNAGAGGLAFVPAESTISGTSSYSSQWYMTTYTRNGNTPTLDLTKLTKVNFTPTQYQQAVSGQVLNSF